MRQLHTDIHVPINFCTRTLLFPRFYASSIIFKNNLLLAHFKAIVLDSMQNLHRPNLLKFLNCLLNPGKFWSSFAKFEIIKKGSHNYQSIFFFRKPQGELIKVADSRPFPLELLKSCARFLPIKIIHLLNLKGQAPQSKEYPCVEHEHR